MIAGPTGQIKKSEQRGCAGIGPHAGHARVRVSPALATPGLLGRFFFFCFFLISFDFCLETLQNPSDLN
jgi:hypothetical protein